MDPGVERYLSSGREARALRTILKDYLARSGLRSRLRHRAVYAVWDRLLGERARHTRIVAARRGVLEVEVDSAPLLQELEFQRHLWVKVLQTEVPNPFVERIVFRLGAFEGTESSDGSEV